MIVLNKTKNAIVKFKRINCVLIAWGVVVGLKLLSLIKLKHSIAII